MAEKDLQTSNDNETPVAIILLEDVTQDQWDDAMANRAICFDDDEELHHDNEEWHFRIVKILDWPNSGIKEGI